MPQNTSPIYTLTPKIGRASWVAATTANTTNGGVGTIGTNMLLCYTAGANGAFINKVRLHPVGLTAATATTATVGRVYISTVASGATTNADTQLYAEVACPAQTTAQTTTATSYIEIPFGIAIAANETILFSMHHAAAANTGWDISVIAG